MHCNRCHNLMFPVELRDWGGGRGTDRSGAWQCFACGNIVDQVISVNRVRLDDLRIDGRKNRARHGVRVMGI